MKKLLLSLATLTFGMSAFAGVVTFDFTVDNYGLTPYNEDLGNASPYVSPIPTTITEGDVVVTLEGNATTDNSGAWRMWHDGLRAYPKQSAAFSVATLNDQPVTYVSWTGKQGLAFALEGTEDAIKEWTGSEEEVSFVCVSSANAAVITLTVGYGDYENEPAPENPAPTEVITVAEALLLISENYTGTVQVKGIISEVASFNSNYGSITYNIVDELGSEDYIQVYSGYGLNGEHFTSKNDLMVGATVVVEGTLTLYTNNDGVEIPEFNYSSILVSYEAPEGGDVPTIPSEPEDIITVMEALDLISKGYEGPATVKGYISEIAAFNESYGDMNYYITDSDGTYSLYIYNGYGLDGEKFTSEEDLVIGGFVIIEGTLTEYNGTAEMARGSKILSYDPAGVTSIEIDLNAPVEYYNLQGIRVNNPVKGGLYILRQGKKAVKTVVR